MSIALDNVTYAAGEKLIVDGVSLAIEKGKVLGLLGPNGSGKSSLLRLICRLRKVRGGVIRLDGADLAEYSQRGIAQRMALVEQQALTDTQVTVLDVVGLGRTPHRGAFSSPTAEDETAILVALDQVGMRQKARQLWHTLSGGERQRVQIARALAQTPRELMLDEPTNHLDIQHQLDILRLVSKLDITCVVALHDLNLAAMFCDRLAVLQHGKVVASGVPEEVLTEDLIKEVFGVDAVIETSPVHGRRNIQYRVD